MVIRVSGGESGRGKQKKSLTKPLKKTPEAEIFTMLEPVRLEPQLLAGRIPYPLAALVFPHQKRIGRMTMKAVCVPRLATFAKYVSSVGLLKVSCSQATYGVSHRTMGRTCSRRRYRHLGSRILSADLSDAVEHSKSLIRTMIHRLQPSVWLVFLLVHLWVADLDPTSIDIGSDLCSRATPSAANTSFDHQLCSWMLMY